MTTIHIPSLSNTTFKALDADTLYVLDANKTLTGTIDNADAIQATSGVAGRNFLIKGDIQQMATNAIGIEIGNSANGKGGGTLEIASTATIESFTGVRTHGDHQVIENFGTISAVYGVNATGEDLSVINRGLIEGETFGIISNDFSGTITNTGTITADKAGITILPSESGAHIVNTGSITSLDTGITMQAGFKDHTFLLNRGSITGTDSAYNTGGGTTFDHVRNAGGMTGGVSLGYGRDIYDGRGGVADLVEGGDGNDTYILSSTATTISEALDHGIDTVKISASYTLGFNFEKLTLLGKGDFDGTGNSYSNTLVGNAGSNVLSGLDSDDRLNGGKGNDTLFGGADYDTFVFSRGSGRDHVGDFNGFQDRLDVRGIAGLDSFADVMAHATQTAGGVVFHFGNGDVLTLDGATLADVTQDHVLF